MRIRTIKPEFWMSESVGRLSREARLLFIGLWSSCDDYGRTRAASRFLASLLYAYDEDVPGRIDGWLAELERAGMVRVYEHEGCRYLDIPKWFEHQKIDRPTKSKLPAFDASSRILASPRETSCQEQGSGIRDQGTGSEGGGACAPDAPKVEGVKSVEPKVTSARFQPPTLDMVKLHAAKVGLIDSDAIAFHSYYESNGWRVGKNPMRSWTAAMTTWKIKREANGYGHTRSRTEQVADDRNRFISDTRTDEQKAADEAAFQARQDAHLARHRALQGL